MCTVNRVDHKKENKYDQNLNSSLKKKEMPGGPKEFAKMSP